MKARCSACVKQDFADDFVVTAACYYAGFRISLQMRRYRRLTRLFLIAMMRRRYVFTGHVAQDEKVGEMAIEASEVERAAARLPAPDSLVALARLRLEGELRALPAQGSLAWRAALLAEPPAVSLGALAHGVRVCVRAGRMAEAQELFIMLLKRTDGLNRRWIAGALGAAHALATERHERTQDLAQDLTLYLWEHVGLRDDEAWELFFQRALAFAQSHVAVSFLRRQGMRADPRVRQAERGLVVVFSRLALAEDGAEPLSLVASGAAFTSAELADLRALIPRLPANERIAVVMRFWQQASEAEIAAALGGITTRAVRYTLRRAYQRLRAWYAGEREVEIDAGSISGEDSNVSQE